MITVRADYGGGPEHLYRLIGALPAGIEVFVACPHDRPYWERYAHQVGAERMIEIPHCCIALRRLSALSRFVRENRLDLIHSHGKGAGVYGRLLHLLTRRPCVHTFHGVHVGEYRGWQRSLYLMLERCLSAVTCKLIAVSPSEGELMRSLRLCRPGKLTVIQNGVVIPAQAAANGRNNGRFTVLSMTRFNYQKNAELLIPIIECLKESGRLQDFQFILLGTGPGEAQLKADVERRGLGAHVTFYGAVPNPGDFLRTASCYLSTSRWEGMPLAVLEAMARGIPVIATAVVGNTDVVRHGETGFLYDLSSPEMAADYVVRLADDLGMWCRLSTAARNLAIQRFGAERMGAETVPVYWSACGYTPGA